MNEMTIKERMLAVYNNQAVDKIPLSIYSRYLPRGSAEREIRNMGMGLIYYFPAVTMLAPPWHLLPGFISEVKGADISIKYYWENGNKVERRCFSTPVGEIYQDVEEDGGGVGSEHIKKHYITSKEDYKIMQYVVENTVFKKNEKQIENMKKAVGDDGVVLARIDRCPYQKLLIELVGAQQLFYDLASFPELVEELMDIMDEKMSQAYGMLAESNADVFWQPDNVVSDLTPPAYFENYCLPYYKKHCKTVKQTNKPYIIHMDGRISALQNLINQTEFDAIESLSFPEIGGDFTLKQAMEAFPEKVILPNIPANIFNNSEDGIKSFIQGLLAETEKSKPFMLQISEDFPGDQYERVLPIICKSMND